MRLERFENSAPTFKFAGYRRTRLEKYADDNHITVESFTKDDGFVEAIRSILEEYYPLADCVHNAFKNDSTHVVEGSEHYIDNPYGLTREAIKIAFRRFEGLRNFDSEAWRRKNSADAWVIMDYAKSYARCELYSRTLDAIVESENITKRAGANAYDERKQKFDEWWGDDGFGYRYAMRVLKRVAFAIATSLEMDGIGGQC